MFKKLVVGGGSTKGLSILGALAYFAESNLLNGIESYYCCSVGSAICLLLAIGMSPMTIFEKALEIELFVALHQDPSKILSAFGLADVSSVSDLLRPLLSEVLGVQDLSFQQLYDLCGKDIYIVGTNITSTSKTTLGHETHQVVFSRNNSAGSAYAGSAYADMSILEAIEISCSLPFIFGEKVYDECEWMDGGFVNDYPIDLAAVGSSSTSTSRSKGRSCGKDDASDGSEILGICISKVLEPGPNKLLNKIWSILGASLQELHRLRMERAPTDATTIQLEVNRDFSNFAMNANRKKEMYREGYEAARTQFDAKQRAKEWEWPDDEFL